jgi:hypothetical protein
MVDSTVEDDKEHKHQAGSNENQGPEAEKVTCEDMVSA